MSVETDLNTDKWAESWVKERVVKGFCILYLSILIFLAFLTPHRWDPSYSPRAEDNFFLPFYSKVLAISNYQSIDLSTFFVLVFDLSGNFLFFIPLPFVLKFTGIKSQKNLFFLSLCASLFIETVQFIFQIGVADIDDVILNSCGAVFGIIILRFFDKRLWDLKLLFRERD